MGYFYWTFTINSGQVILALMVLLAVVVLRAWSKA